MKTDTDRVKTAITVARIERPRWGPKTVVFNLETHGYSITETRISVHQSYPDDIVEQVARTFLHRHLLELASEAGHGTFSDEEIQNLWARFRPTVIQVKV